MERKYYLRGLGIGIAVTAIIMGIALSGDKAMTDDEIIARAKELGMVENTVLSDKGNKETEQENTGDDRVVEVADQQQDITQSERDEVQNAPAVDGTEADDETDAEIDADAENEEPDGSAGEADSETESGDTAAGQEQSNESITSSTIRVITINSGDGSYTVSRKLADVGVVTSAETFDTFLCENGYDKRLRTGTFSIPSDASDEQIARIITGAE